MLHGLLNLGFGASLKDAVQYRNRLIRSGRIDPWDSCDEDVRLYKPVLERIAAQITGLSQENIRTRFSIETRKIELYGEKTREIIFSVQIRGKDGDAYAIVERPRFLHAMPDNLKALFVEAFPIRIEFR